MTTADIPTLGEWAVIVLMLAMGAFAFRRLRKRGVLMGAALGLVALVAASGALFAVGGLASAVHDPDTMLAAPNGHLRQVSVRLTAGAGQTVTGMAVHYRKTGDASWKVTTGTAAPTGGCPNCWAATMDTTGWVAGDTIEYYFKGIVGGTSSFVYEDASCVACRTMFVTQSTFNGNLGGVTGADAKCNADANRNPAKTYRALIMAAGQRELGLNWALAPSTTYKKSDGVTVLGQTDDQGRLVFPLTNALVTEEVAHWTGIDHIGWTPTWDCSGWTASTGGMMGGAFGQAGYTNRTDFYFINHSPPGCNYTNRLVCVEQ
jgi:hypothetical protein